MSLVTAIIMQKGGVGKTTTAINLAAGGQFGDYRVLLIDLDPQGNASSGLGQMPEEGSTTIYDVLCQDQPLAEVIKPTSMDNLDLAGANLDLSGARAQLPQNNSKYLELEQQLESVRDQYDWILIDCPPSLGPLTLNALRAANSLIIPLQAEYYALEGVSQLWNTIQHVQDGFNSSLRLTGILLTMFDQRTNLADQVRDEVKNHFKDKVFDTIIPRDIRISEAPGYGEPVITHAPDCRGTDAYLSATEEVIYREQKRLRTRAGRTAAPTG